MAILITDLTNIQLTLQNTFQEAFQLTSYEDGTDALVLAAGNSQRVGNALYYIASGDYNVLGSVSDGACYIYLSDLGAGIGAATLSNTDPTFYPNLGGYYNTAGDRAIFSMTQDGTSYINRVRLVDKELKNARDRQFILALIL